jgi:hypothetical protein
MKRRDFISLALAATAGWPRHATARSGRSVANLELQAPGPVAIWDGEPRRTSIEHDSIYDEL